MLLMQQLLLTHCVQKMNKYNWYKCKWVWLLPQWGRVLCKSEWILQQTCREGQRQCRSFSTELVRSDGGWFSSKRAIKPFLTLSQAKLQLKCCFSELYRRGFPVWHDGRSDSPSHRYRWSGPGCRTWLRWRSERGGPQRRGGWGGWPLMVERSYCTLDREGEHRERTICHVNEQLWSIKKNLQVC